MLRMLTFAYILMYFMVASLISQPFDIEFDDFPDNSVPELANQPSVNIKELQLPAVAMVSTVNLTRLPASEDVVGEQCGMDMFGFPDALVEGCVNVITGDFQETACDFSAPGVLGLNMQRFYCGSKRHSLHHGWQLSHGAKLLYYEGKRHFCTAMKGGDRHGVQYKQTPLNKGLARKDPLTYLCQKDFFSKNITNFSFGYPCAGNDLKNDRLREVLSGFELTTGNQNRYAFAKSAHDPENEKHTHAYRLEKISLANGSAYTYRYCQSLGCPIWKKNTLALDPMHTITSLKI